MFKIILGSLCFIVLACVAAAHPEVRSWIENEFIPVAFAADSPELICPEEYEPGDNVVLHPHESNCSMFYICAHGQPVPTSCPEGLEFNAELLVCDNPETSNCFHDKINRLMNDFDSMEGSGDPEIVSNGCRDEIGTSYLSHETSCRKYYQCVDGVKTEKSCLIGFHFNLEKERCVLALFAGCYL